MEKQCSKCGQLKDVEEFSPRADGVFGRHAHCKACRRSRWLQHEKQVNERRRGLYAANEKFRQSSNAAAKRYRERNKQRLSERNRIRYRQMKTTIIKRYGGKCECCNESRIEFLVIDHVEGGGTGERKNLSPTGVFRKLLMSEEIMTGYRVLCHNCNSALAYYGYCPHQPEEVPNASC